MKPNLSQEPLETLTEIRDLMERSSRFISLSGLSGVFAGIFALIGAGIAYVYLGLPLNEPADYRYYSPNGRLNPEFATFFLIDAAGVLVCAGATAIFLTTRKARKQGLSIWTSTTRRLAINLIIPLAAGGIFCLALLAHGIVGLAAPATLVFYGLALLNASKYTLRDIHYLGLIEVALGLLASFFIGYGLLFWAIGFGVMHIIYGTMMYYKYER
jgi:general stress protein CsbA